MKPNMNQLLKQAQKMQENLARVQAELANITVEGSAGGGMVKVTANCQNQILEVSIEPEVINEEEKEMLEDLIVA
ncbi:MAG: YbaB/EbfC family nucleoid-associated protein, partial [Calditrichaeota bacterium]